MIDLGVLSTGVEPTPAAAWRPRWRHRPALVRWVLVVVVGATMAGSAAPVELVVSIPAPPGSAGLFEVVGDLLFVAEPGAGWAVHDPSTGERLWTLESSDEQSVGLVAFDGVLWDRRGIRRDPATGEVLPSGRVGVPDSHRYFSLPGVETLVVASEFRPYDDSAVDAEFGYEVMGVDVETGLVLWRDQPDVGVRVWLTGDPARLVTISADELVSVRDPATGRVLASRRVPGVTSAEIAGERLLVRVRQDGETILRGYAAETMTERWELTGPSESAEPCGPMLCVPYEPEYASPVPVAGITYAAPRTTTVVDPVTGRVAWTLEGHLYPVGEAFLAHDNRGRLRALLDAGTGQPLRDLTGWRAVIPASEAAPAAPVTLLRTDSAGDTRVAWLDPDTGELTDLGRLPARPVRCQPYSAGVVCLHADRVWVWPL